MENSSRFYCVPFNILPLSHSAKRMHQRGQLLAFFSFGELIAQLFLYVPTLVTLRTQYCMLGVRNLT